MTIKCAFSAIVGLAAASLVAPSAAEAAPITVPSNGQTVLNGVPVGCTGIGQARNAPKWASYPVRVEFAGVSGDFLANVVAVLSRVGGRPILEVGCDGPWVLFKLPPGRYSVQGRVMGSDAPPQTATFSVPAMGQARVVLHFPGA